uniref:Uncharacterized protein n=1 Tax=Physcomitrium patens TaxID=3218 RepID=A0A7I4B7A2_PHYPA
MHLTESRSLVSSHRRQVRSDHEDAVSPYPGYNFAVILFNLTRGKIEFGSIEVKAKHPHDNVVKEFRGHFKSFTIFNMWRCSSITSLPNKLDNLTFLTTLDV